MMKESKKADSGDEMTNEDRRKSVSICLCVSLFLFCCRCCFPKGLQRCTLPVFLEAIRRAFSASLLSEAMGWGGVKGAATALVFAGRRISWGRRFFFALPQPTWIYFRVDWTTF